MKQPLKINGKKGDVKDNVKFLLETDPSLRDDVLRTTVNYWNHFDGKKNNLDLGQISAKQFFSLYSKGYFEHQASIARQWQKVQEENPNLRGETWKKRQKHTTTVKKDLGYRG